MHQTVSVQPAVCAVRLWSGPDNTVSLLREAFARRSDCSSGPTPAGQPVWLQSPGLAALSLIGADWGDGEQHILLIKDPRAALAELTAYGPPLRAEDLGLPQLNRLFERVVDCTGQPPAIIDSQRFLHDPEAHLRALCVRLGLDFDARMADGIREQAAEHLRVSLATPSALAGTQDDQLLAECMPMYRRLYQHHLLPN